MIDRELVIFIVIGLPVICGTLIGIVAIIFGSKRKKNSGQSSDEEIQLMQEMHQSLIRMEKRIDSLETIYFEIDRKKESEKL